MAQAATAAPEAEATTPQPVAESKYLTFALCDEEYGVPILRVREIIGILPITAVPDAPAAIRGVVNLRGRIIPVMDLRRRFGVTGDSADFERACIIVLEITKGDGLVDVGILIDEVSEVISVDKEDIELPPDISTHAASNCIAGLANANGDVRILIDVDQLLTEKQVQETISAQPGSSLATA